MQYLDCELYEEEYTAYDPESGEYLTQMQTQVEEADRSWREMRDGLSENLWGAWVE